MKERYKSPTASEVRIDIEDDIRKKATELSGDTIHTFIRRAVYKMVEELEKEKSAHTPRN